MASVQGVPASMCVYVYVRMCVCESVYVCMCANWDAWGWGYICVSKPMGIYKMVSSKRLGDLGSCGFLYA